MPQHFSLPSVWRKLAFMIGLAGGACNQREPVADAPIRPGDTLLDHLADAELSGFPDSNLPSKLIEIVQQPFVIRSAALTDDDWHPWRGKIPRAYQGRIAPELLDELAYYRINLPPATLSVDNVRVIVSGAPVPLWDPATSFPNDGEAFFLTHDSEASQLHAITRRPPSVLQLEYDAEPYQSLPEWEHPLRRPQSAMDLRRRFCLNDISVDGLLLPPPSTLRFASGTLGCDRLVFSVAILDHCLVAQDGTLQMSTQQSDGVEIQVQVCDQKTTTTVFTEFIPRERVGRSLQRCVVDLSAHYGEDVSLQFTTNAGPANDPHFDYAILSELRMYGPPAKPPQRPPRDFDRSRYFACRPSFLLWV